jgi:hypothetical protein
MKPLINFYKVLAVFVCLAGCTKNESFYYTDKSTPGEAIFSNMGNNVFSCLINGQLCRTFDRKVGGWGGSSFEVRGVKNYLDSISALLSITWSWHYASDNNGFGDIRLVLSVPRSFGMNDFNDLQGKRLAIDGSNNYFIDEAYPQSREGSGTIYFNIASLDSSSFGYQGRISGLLEEDFGIVKLTSGRFDHILEQPQVLFY